MYSLAHPDTTAMLLAAAEQLLRDTGEAVALCDNFGTHTQTNDEETNR
ncbi:hypothetical protein GCM10027078_31210 [Nocardioides flavus (ex Wang et al. 2016)]